MRYFLILGIGIALGWFYWHRMSLIPLPSDLEQIKCGHKPENNQYARVDFGEATAFYLCVSEKQAAYPEALKCLRETRTCRETGHFVLSRLLNGEVYADYLSTLENLKLLQIPPSNDFEQPYESEIVAGFTIHPITPEELEKYNYSVSQYNFSIPETELFFPEGFEILQEPKCDQYANALNDGTCRFKLRTKTLDWDIAVSIRLKQGTEITKDAYISEINFWNKYLTQMVVDSAINNLAEIYDEI